MNHFSYPLTIVQINIFKEPQNIFSQPKSQTPNYRASPPVFLTTECPPGHNICDMFTTVYIYGNAITLSAKQRHSHYNTFATNLRLIHIKSGTVLTARLGFLQQPQQFTQYDKKSTTITTGLRLLYHNTSTTGSQQDDSPG